VCLALRWCIEKCPFLYKIVLSCVRMILVMGVNYRIMMTKPQGLEIHLPVHIRMLNTTAAVAAEI
jgi:hypothetical protein